MNILIGELISQIRNLFKTVHQDNLYVSDRLIYSLIKKHLALFLYREDSKMKISQIRAIFTVLPCVELIDVDLVEANCLGLKSDCTIKRTKKKLPPLIQGFNMPIIGSVSSIDGRIFLTATTPAQYVKKANASDFKYNKTLYFWYLNGYLYFPNLTWDAVRVEVVLDGVALDKDGQVDECAQAQDVEFGIPEYLMSTVQAEVIKDLSLMFQIPKDPVIDKQTT